MADPDPLTALLNIPGDLRDHMVDRGQTIEITKDLLQRAREIRARRHAIASVPSTPRHLQRTVGGVAVAKGHGRNPWLSMDRLRDEREASPLLGSIHNARQYQLRRMARKWDGTPGHVGIRVVHKDHTDWKSTPPAGFDRWIKQFESVLWNPSPTYRYNTLGSALAALEEDMLTINRPVVELIPSLLNPRRIVQWRPVDGALIWDTLQWVEHWKAENPRWSGGYDRRRLSPDDTLDLISYQINHDLHGAEHVLVRDGVAEAAYPPGRLIVAPIQNRTDVRFVGYPPSHVEQAIAYIRGFLNVFEYNTNLFTRGMLSEIAIGIPADLHDDDAIALRDMFRESTQGVDRAHQPVFLPIPRGGGKIEVVRLKDNPRDMGFETLASLMMAGTASIYRMHLSTIGAKAWAAGGANPLSEGNETEQIALAQEEGLQGDMGHLIDEFLTPMAQRCHPDLRVIAEYGDFDPQKEASIYEIHAQIDMSRNEVRIERGARPRGFYLSDEKYETASDDDRQKHDDNPWNWPTDQTFAGAIGQTKMRDMQQAQQAPQPAGPGQEDNGFGGQDDGFGAAGTDQASPYGQPEQPDQANQPPAQAGSPLAKGVRTVHIHIHDRQREYP